MPLCDLSMVHLMQVMARPIQLFDDGPMEKQAHTGPRPLKSWRLRLIMAVSLAIFLLAAMASSLSAQEEVWTVLLRDQLLADLQCELNYTTNLRKFELAGQQALDVRAHCKDKRAFDASWRPEKQRYEFRQCEPVVC